MKKAMVFLFLFGVLGFGTYQWMEKEKKVTAGETSIFKGASVRQISQILESAGVIQHADTFYYYIKVKDLYMKKVQGKPQGLAILFKEGEYDVPEGDFDDLIKQLNKGTGRTEGLVTFTIPEGKQVEGFGAILEKRKLFTQKEFVAFTNNPEKYKYWKSKYPWLPEANPGKKNLLEGYIHANTYTFPVTYTMDHLVDMMLKETDRWYKDYQSEIVMSGYSFDQLLTLASVVEGESKFEQDRPKVAQVFLNRLKIGMKLESDMTAAYANGEHKVFMYYSDIQTDSPYNTYVVPGLPLGPVNSPSKQAFLGVLHPEGPNFTALFFYARPSGETFYATTPQEHEANRIAWESEWKQLEQGNQPAPQPEVPAEPVPAPELPPAVPAPQTPVVDPNTDPNAAAPVPVVQP